MEDRELIEIRLGDRDAELLPPLREYFKSYWSDTSEEPRAKFNKLRGLLTEARRCRNG